MPRSSSSKITPKAEDRFRSTLVKQRVTLMGQMRAAHVAHRFRCHACLNQWKSSIDALDMDAICPFCSGVKRPGVRSRLKYKQVSIKGKTIHVQGYEEHAIKWILKHRGLKLKDLVLDSSGMAPVVRYKIGRRNRGYYPDIFIPKENRVVEVKSDYTLGLSTGRMWGKNQQKAKAVIAAGYEFVVMVFNQDGKRLWIPDDWYKLSRAKVLELVRETRGE